MNTFPPLVESVFVVFRVPETDFSDLQPAFEALPKACGSGDGSTVIETNLHPASLTVHCEKYQ
jgi:hypothetical protein